MMRYLFVALVGLMAGCGTCGQTNSVGWRYEIGRPSVMLVPAAMQQTSGQLEMLPTSTAAVPGVMGMRSVPLSYPVQRAAFCVPDVAMDPCAATNDAELLRQMEHAVKSMQERLDSAKRMMDAQRMPKAPQE